MQYRSICNIFNSFGNALLFRYICKGRLVKISENIAFSFNKEIYMKYLILYYNVLYNWMVISVLFPETLHIPNIVLYGGIVFLCTVPNILWESSNQMRLFTCSGKHNINLLWVRGQCRKTSYMSISVDITLILVI